MTQRRKAIQGRKERQECQEREGRKAIQGRKERQECQGRKAIQGRKECQEVIAHQHISIFSNYSMVAFFL